MRSFASSPQGQINLLQLLSNVLVAASVRCLKTVSYLVKA